MKYYIDYLQYWRASLHIFGRQRVRWFSGKTWNDYISGEPVKLWGKAPETLQKEIARYWQRPLPVRWVLSRVTPIQQKEKLWLYYLNRQSFNTHYQTLSVPQKQMLQQPILREYLNMQKHPIKKETKSTTNPFSSSINKAWRSLWARANATLSEPESQMQREQAFALFSDEFSKFYRGHQALLRNLYTVTTSSLTAELCFEQENKFAEARKIAVVEAIKKYKAQYLMHCTEADKRQFNHDANQFFEKAERAIEDKLKEIAFSATVLQGEWLRKRYVDQLALVPVPLNTRPFQQLLAKSNFNALKAEQKLIQLEKNLKLNLPPNETQQLFNQYHEIAAAHLEQLTNEGQRTIQRARSLIASKKTSEGNIPVPTAHENAKQVLNQFYRKASKVLHPNIHYDDNIKQMVESLFKQFLDLKNRCLEKLEKTANPNYEIAQIQAKKREETEAYEKAMAAANLKLETLEEELKEAKKTQKETLQTIYALLKQQGYTDEAIEEIIKPCKTPSGSQNPIRFF